MYACVCAFVLYTYFCIVLLPQHDNLNDPAPHAFWVLSNKTTGMPPRAQYQGDERWSTLSKSHFFLLLG